MMYSTLDNLYALYLLYKLRNNPYGVFSLDMFTSF